jgi:hypothetical protein
MRPLARAVRRSAALALAAGLALAPPARAQTVSVGFAPGCGPGTGCGTARFVVGAPASGFALTTLTLTFTGGPYRFAPSQPGAPSTGTYVAQDDLGAFGGFTAVGPAGVQLFADFLDTGDPANPGLPFTLGGGSSGTFDVEVAPAAAGEFALVYAATLQGGGRISGAVTPSVVIPEPAPAALLAPGALALLAAARRRRRAPASR